MDYIDILRPVLSLAAHAARSGGGKMPTAQRLALRERLAILLDAARSHRRHAVGGAFDSAWFAVCAWLDETFPGDAPFVHRYFSPGDSGEAFFTKLDRLLNAPGLERFDPERLQAIEVFAACLELGFHGPYHTPPERPAIREYLDCCRRELAAGSASVSAALALPKPKVKRKAPGRLATISSWLIPVAATLVLYALYSRLLADLCLGVMG